VLTADAIIAVDGGIGTLSEAAIAWSVLQPGPVAADLTFLGAGWPPVSRTSRPPNRDNRGWPDRAANGGPWVPDRSGWRCDRTVREAP
jgi:hypothetical protein